MPTFPRDQIERVLADVIREALSERRPVQVPGLGTFEVSHRASERIASGTGEEKLLPPRDEIVFIPEE